MLCKGWFGGTKGDVFWGAGEWVLPFTPWKCFKNDQASDTKPVRVSCLSATYALCLLEKCFCLTQKFAHITTKSHFLVILSYRLTGFSFKNEHETKVLHGLIQWFVTLLTTLEGMKKYNYISAGFEMEKNIAIHQ